MCELNVRRLLFDTDVRARISAVIARAMDHPIAVGQLERIHEGLETPPTSFDRGFFTEIPEGFGAVFTIEEHPSGWHRHLSVFLAPSHVYRAGDRPLGTEVALIMFEFGMGPIECLERLYHTRTAWKGIAWNVLEPITSESGSYR
jgi:hypothetical protein